MSEPDKEKDDLADALNRLASGEAPSSPEGIPSAQVPITPKKKRPEAPSTSRVNPGLRSGAAKARPNAPGVQPPSPKPTVVPKPRATVSGVKPPKPVRPAAPTLSQGPTPPIGSQSSPPAEASEISSSLANVIEDDDAMNVPAPERSVFVHHPPPLRPPATPLYARLSFRRTIIPILLTMGVALPVCAGWWFSLDKDAPLRSIGLRFPITLAVIGFVMLGLAVMNMLHVKRKR
jgi:hypothetical protein